MPRDRQQTSSRIKQAAICLLQREGFAGWGINAIAREAAADKVLIYRYFESLEGLLSDIISETRFWPDPETLTDTSAEEFIEDTIQFQNSNMVAKHFIGLPESNPCCVQTKEKFSHDLDIWLKGFRKLCTGYISEEHLMRLPALLHFQLTSGKNLLSSREIWQQISPPLEWKSKQAFEGFEELPTELL